MSGVSRWKGQSRSPANTQTTRFALSFEMAPTAPGQNASPLKRKTVRRPDLVHVLSPGKEYEDDGAGDAGSENWSLKGVEPRRAKDWGSFWF